MVGAISRVLFLRIQHEEEQEHGGKRETNNGPQVPLVFCFHKLGQLSQYHTQFLFDILQIVFEFTQHDVLGLQLFVNVPGHLLDARDGHAQFVQRVFLVL